MTSWLDDARRVPLSELAPLLGYAVHRGAISPCPSCAAAQRSERHRDRRRPVGILRGDASAKCFRCNQKFSAVDLAAWSLFGGRLEAGDPRWAELREWFAAQGLLGSSAPCTVRGQAAMCGRGLQSSKPPEDQGSPPPSSEVEAFWASCTPVTDHPDALRWASSRALDPSALARFDLARALPRSGRLPTWARTRAGDWRQSGHALLVPLWDARGRLASFKARLVASRDQQTGAHPKELAPIGFSTRGLVLAEATARSWLTSQVPDAENALSRLLIVEGVPDFLTWSCRFTESKCPTACPVLGVSSGAWSGELASRVPRGTTVILRTHDDEAGHRYAAEIAASLADRCTLLRALAGRGAQDGG